MAPWNGQVARLSAGTGPLEEIDRDVLITRIIDARAGAADWKALRDAAAKDAGVWTDLEQATCEARALERAMAPVAAAADGVNLPTLSVDVAGAPVVVGRIGFGGARTGLGWLVAALVALGWGAQWFSPMGGGGGGNVAILGPLGRTADAALNEYLDLGKKAGRVVAEMPERVVLESRPSEDGKGYEVLYLRQVLERAVVGPEDLYKLGVKEDGRTMLIPAGTPAAAGKPGGPAM
ncbi:MAG: hypothetical protein ACKVS8_10400 [Phycisphaerales bacterium]